MPDQTQDRHPHYLSLGAGVQSSALALMAASGEIGPMPRVAIFADTGDEPAPVYAWLDWLRSVLPFQVVTVRHKSGLTLADAATSVRVARASGNRYTKHNVPVFIRSPEGKIGLMQRYCTLDFKVDPIRRYVRSDLRALRASSATVWIGISRDEASRMKASPVSWIEHRWPLVDAGITRADCLRWMADRGHPIPPRSACVYCPYHSDAEWLRLKVEDPQAFMAAVAFERRYQDALAETTLINGTPFLHRSAVPLDEVDFLSSMRVRSSQGRLFDDPFGNECEGMCGN